MFRWSTIRDTNIFGIDFKMYRDPYSSLNTTKSAYGGLEFDHYAFEYMESELFFYRILDINFVNYIEERGDLDRVKDISIPISQDILGTVY